MCGFWWAREFGEVDAAEVARVADAVVAVDALGMVDGAALAVDALGAAVVDSRTISSGSKRMTSG